MNCAHTKIYNYTLNNLFNSRTCVCVDACVGLLAWHADLLQCCITQQSSSGLWYTTP